MVTIEGIGWQDYEELELPAPPREGDAVETKYGTCIVTKVEPAPDTAQYQWKIVCRTS